TALAGRVLEPGVKADMVPILVGPQGCGKSSGVEALSPDPAFFTEIGRASHAVASHPLSPTKFRNPAQRAGFFCI
ncbi:putative replication protein, partial [Salmonella enterica subsp. enterica serovar Tallahassee str. 0012]